MCHNNENKLLALQFGDRCQAKFLTCEMSDFTPCAHAQSNILRVFLRKILGTWYGPVGTRFL